MGRSERVKLKLCICGCGEPVALWLKPGHHLKIKDYVPLPTQMICQYCSQPFANTNPKHRTRMQPYCCISCSQKGRWANNRVWLICHWCKSDFSRPLSYFKSYLNKGELRFCCKPCKSAYHEARAAKGEGAMYAIRRWLLKSRGQQCESCGYFAVPDLLVVHHLQGNGSDNGPDNLKILCPTCHAEHHWALSKQYPAKSPKAHTVSISAHRSLALRH